MERFLGRYADTVYAILRIVVGLLFACHGAQKLFGIFGGFQHQPGATVPIASQMGLAAVIEFVGGLLIALGLVASWAAFIASGEMAVGYFQAHFPKGFWPIVNLGELAVVYCFLFLYIAARGSGRWSVDSVLHRGR